jgi:hypothetical protein
MRPGPGLKRWASLFLKIIINEERMKHTTPPTIFAYGLIGSLKDFGHHLCTDQAKLSLL